MRSDPLLTKDGELSDKTLACARAIASTDWAVRARERRPDDLVALAVRD